MGKLAKDCYTTLKPGGHVALIIKGIKDENWEYFINLLFKCLAFFEAVGFKQIEEIEVPLSPETETGYDVERCKRLKRLYTLHRVLMILRKEEEKEATK
jgi:hypothetical protein